MDTTMWVGQVDFSALVPLPPSLFVSLLGRDTGRPPVSSPDSRLPVTLEARRVSEEGCLETRCRLECRLLLAHTSSALTMPD